jgi:hypothetical protein
MNDGPTYTRLPPIAEHRDLITITNDGECDLIVQMLDGGEWVLHAGQSAVFEQINEPPPQSRTQRVITRLRKWIGLYVEPEWVPAKWVRQDAPSFL